MSKFQFRHAALLRFRMARRDQCRQILAQLLAEDRRLAAEQTSIDGKRHHQLDELRQLGHGPVDVDRSIARRYYAAQLVREIQEVERNRNVVSQQLALCREALAKADQEVKVLEKLKEKQQAAFEYDQGRRSARELEEVWIAGHLEELRR